jgi:hypothetical protein
MPTEPIRLMDDYAVRQECTNSGRQVAVEIVFCTMTPKICGSSVWIELHVSLLAPPILRWCLDFCKTCGSLPSTTLFCIWPAPTLSPTSLMARLFSNQIPFPVIHQHPSNLVHSTHAYLPVKMEECSETSAYKFKTPGNYPKESIQHVHPCPTLYWQYTLFFDENAYPQQDIYEIWGSCDWIATSQVLSAVLPKIRRVNSYRRFGG